MAKAKTEKNEKSRKKKARRQKGEDEGIDVAAAPFDSAAAAAEPLAAGDGETTDEVRPAPLTPKLLRRVKRSAELAARAAARLVEATEEFERVLREAPAKAGKREKK